MPPSIGQDAFLPYVIPEPLSEWSSDTPLWHRLIDDSGLEGIRIELIHWLLFCPQIVIDNPLQFILYDLGYSNRASHHRHSTVIRLFPSYLQFVQNMSPLIRDGHLVLAEDSWRWRSATNFRQRAESFESALESAVELDSSAIEDAIDEREQQEKLARRIHEVRLEEDVPMEGFDAWSYLSSGGHIDSEDVLVDEPVDEMEIRAEERSATERLLEDFEEPIDTGWAGLRKPSEFIPDGVEWRSVAVSLRALAELQGQLAQHPDYRSDYNAWLWHLHARVFARNHLGSSLVFPDDDHEEVYLRSLSSLTDASAKPLSSTQATVRRLISLHLPRIRELAVADLVSIRQNDELFADWRRALRRSLNAVERFELTDAETYASELNLELGDRIRQLEKTIQQSQFLRQRMVSAGAIPFVVGVGQIAITGDPSGLLVGGASFGLLGLVRYLRANSESEVQRLIAKHHVVFNPV